MVVKVVYGVRSGWGTRRKEKRDERETEREIEREIDEVRSSSQHI